MINFLLGDAIDAIVLEYCSVYCRLQIYLKLLDRVVCGAVFLTGGVFSHLMPHGLIRDHEI